ncbi:methionyl-tRNA formyltransferase [Microvirga terrestris]|uniref:Methionyl-tRNA formyltransferase n=1 Tax=Microvirga terrestris TaxID=2791024 RepID=A0ABS0HPF3_9HYPH|nr:formyltransferase family protein [Microvirga terrestris]MBF9195357.1 hypothetical protein [Microvirga terrestris]
MITADRKVIVCAAGLKGANFVRGLVNHEIRLDRIYAYKQPDDHSDSFFSIKQLAETMQIEFRESRKPEFSSSDLIFIIGWQYMFATITPFSVVFHDSLLPKYRGFAPTVTALLKGDTQIGVTALTPTPGVDEGPIIGQLAVQIAYPIKIKTALDLQSDLMISLATQIHRQWSEGFFTTCEQEHARATYSLWRNDADYLIDWSKTASEIVRAIDALGYPYSGARTTANGETLIIESASEVDDLNFEIRQPGKIWTLDGGRPLVVCGSGLLRLEDCRTLNGARYDFRRTRIKLGESQLK